MLTVLSIVPVLFVPKEVVAPSLGLIPGLCSIDSGEVGKKFYIAAA